MNKWILGARPRTLPAAVVPVAVGTVICVGEAGAVWWRAILALLVSLALQIAVNYANDYSDGVRGTDEVRVGPMRLVGSGAAPARHVKLAAMCAFGVAAVFGLVLVIVTTWVILLVGMAAILAGWFYTGGKNPYGYFGLGEVFVFVFFGLVATVGTTFVVLERMPALSWLMGTSVGCLACALLVINNLRDIPTDRVVGKRTLAVRLGDQRTRYLYVALMVLGVLSGSGGTFWNPWLLLVLATGIFVMLPISKVRGGATGKDLIEVLGDTGRSQLILGVLVTVAFIIGG